MRIDGFGELEAVLAVARHRSFSSAANELGVSRSAVSQTVAAIESRLGVLLFHRTTRSVSLTDAGRHFASAIAPALQMITDASDQVSAQSNSPSGTLRLNGSVRGLRQAMPMLLAFMDRYPLIQLELKGDDHLVDIVSDGFDIGIRLGGVVPKDMIAVPFGEPQRHVVVGSTAYFANRPVPARPEDVLDHQCVRFRMTAGHLHPWEFAQGAKKYSLNPPGGLIVNSSYLAREAVVKGVALAYCSEAIVASDLAAGTMRSVLETWIPASERLCLYFSNRRHLPGSFKALVEFAKSWGDPLPNQALNKKKASPLT